MNREEIDRRLQEFRQDPKAAMQRLPQKRDAAGRILPEVATPFEADAIKDGRFVTQKDTVRQTFHTVVDDVTISLSEVLPGRAPIEKHDRPENLVDNFHYATLADIDGAGLHQASLSESPWSDDYWAIYQGVLGCRYADPEFPGRDAGWEENFDYVRQRPAPDIVAGGDAAAIDRLSPSEKYDLLVGDANGTLTAAMWSEGKAYHDRTGTVETWMGICHGWAPAAYMLPRPRRAVTALAADGNSQLRFYPSDVKALASLLWANAGTDTRFIGGRSDDKDPAVDEVGRVTSGEVFDTNPGTWHLSIVNQLAGARSFVMDATYDYEVWNQPLFSYDYAYFNPQEDRPASDLEDATVWRDSFANDRFKKYRSPDMTAVVGVAMRVGYVVETPPSHAPSDDSSNDEVNWVDYLYDIELGSDGRILGGEWWQNPHPDFLWTPPPGARALTPADEFATGSWTVSEPVPDPWRRAAWRASRNRLPLAKLVEELIRAANA